MKRMKGETGQPPSILDLPASETSQPEVCNSEQTAELPKVAGESIESAKPVFGFKKTMWGF